MIKKDEFVKDRSNWVVEGHKVELRFLKVITVGVL